MLGTNIKGNNLGGTMNADVHVLEQCVIAFSKGNQIFGLLRAIPKTVDSE